MYVTPSVVRGWTAQSRAEARASQVALGEASGEPAGPIDSIVRRAIPKSASAAPMWIRRLSAW